MALEQLHAFFIDQHTGMTPRLTFPEGKATDLVDLYDLPRLLDAVALMQDKMPAGAVHAMRVWFREYLSRITDIRSHYHPSNPHMAGGPYDVLRMSLATCLGQSDVVREQADDVRSRLEQAIKADGETPLPTGLQMDALAIAADLALRVGVDLWTHATPVGGGSLIKAVEALVTDANSNDRAPDLFDRTLKLAVRYAAKVA